MKKFMAAMVFTMFSMFMFGCDLGDNISMVEMYKVTDKNFISPSYVIEITNINEATHNNTVYAGGTLKLDVAVDIITYTKYNIGDLWQEPVEQD